jgi:DNA-binding FadR family transcriptional regulator
MNHLLDSELLRYFISSNAQPGDQIPALGELSVVLGISVGKLREQLEVARALGLVEVRPRTGVRFLGFNFLPAIRLSLRFALAQDKTLFFAFTELRNQLEASFWEEAVSRLTQADYAALRLLIEKARAKLADTRFIQIPHEEHRDFHLGIFANLPNPFVLGLLAAYWEGYEAVELNAYSDLHYWQAAWDYHEKILAALEQGEIALAKQAFIDHTRLLRHRNAPATAEPVWFGGSVSNVSNVSHLASTVSKEN